jgi:hypothetical protein
VAGQFDRYGTGRVEVSAQIFLLVSTNPGQTKKRWILVVSMQQNKLSSTE